MVRGTHPGRIGVPVKQVERQRLAPAHVIVDDIGPDQVARAQHVEGGRHLGAVEIALVAHRPLQRGDLLVIDEHLEIAGMGEVDLRGEQRRRTDALVVVLRH
jgi:hypothetical protein